VGKEKKIHGLELRLIGEATGIVITPKTVWAPAHDACDGCDDITGAVYVYNENE
jgi:hypothetical protein